MPKHPEKAAYYHEHYLRTKEKRKAQKRAVSEQARQRRRETDLLWRYGLGTDQLRRLLEAQDGRCAICRHAFDGVGKQGTPHIDHLHEPGQPPRAGQVRGLLCNSCNKGLGHFIDKPERLIAASAYLLNPPAYALIEPKPQLRLFDEKDALCGA